MSWTAITLEGGLLPPDLVERVGAGDADVVGQRPVDFGIPGSLTGEIQSTFARAMTSREEFAVRLGRQTQSPTTLTREYVRKFLRECLGWHDLVPIRTSLAAGGSSWDISDIAGSPESASVLVPVHIVPAGQALDRRQERAARTPHATVQDYLNRSDALWGIVTDGSIIRILRDTTRLTRLSYVDFDLEAILTGGLYAEFVVLFRLLHRSRFPQPGQDPAACLLEQYYQQGLELGGKVRDKLRDGVERALVVLGSGFLRHPGSGTLRDQVAAGRLDAAGYYRQLLRLIYRFLFLAVAEERRLLTLPDGDPRLQQVYRDHYSLGRLRAMAEQPRVPPGHGDLWEGMKQAFRVFRDAALARSLGLGVLDGELFGPTACPDLEAASLDNRDLLEAIAALSRFQEETGRGRRPRPGAWRRVNYGALDVEELGSVYESLLELHPLLDLADRDQPFGLSFGNERKATGSYYTPAVLVNELVESALFPVLEKRLDAAGQDPAARRQAVLDLRVIDPASGSGHFLLAAARRLAREIAHIDAGSNNAPTPDQHRRAMREVIRHCIYAVDLNPLAVDLCKVALWIEGHEPGAALSFLDNHVRLGNSLVGVFDLACLEAGIPDDAYEPVEGDDKLVASDLKSTNRKQVKEQAKRRVAVATGQQSLDQGLTGVAGQFSDLADLDDRTPDDVAAKAALYAGLQARGTRWWQFKVACDLWTAAFFLPKRAGAGNPVPTSRDVWNALPLDGAPGTGSASSNPALEDAALAVAAGQRFFHWPLEFPDVMARGGFDVVLGNPPWERIKLSQKEFFATRDRHVASAPNAAVRRARIQDLATTNPRLWEEFQSATQAARRLSGWLHNDQRFPLCGRGDVNLYAVFAETMRNLLAPDGRAGILVPSGIATDATTGVFFRNVVDTGSLASLFDFENSRKLFPAVHGRMKFSLLTLARGGQPAATAGFYLTSKKDLDDPDRRITLEPGDIALINPNTGTVPLFRTNRDAAIARKLYRRAGVLVRDEPAEGEDPNPWGVSFQRMFDMSNDSPLFRTRQQLEARGCRLDGNHFIAPGGERWLPLYEAKLFHQYDHRWASFEPQAETDPGRMATTDLDDRAKADPHRLVLPRYWVHEREVAARLARGRDQLASPGPLFDQPGEAGVAAAEREREKAFQQLRAAVAGCWPSGTSPAPPTNGRESSR